MKYVIGIDEAGRGPLAGPISVGVVLIPKNLKPKTNLTNIPLRDSKKLPEHARESWLEYIRSHPKIFFKTALVHPKTIDRINITQATNLAATRALKKLIEEITPPKSTKILTDYGICPDLNAAPYTLNAIVKGDERITAIQLASIAAKTRRDKYIKEKHRKYPRYNFEKHKGYGTKEHRKNLKKHGPCPLHRLTFISKYTNI